MAKCPECGGLAKWRSPFYVCTVCGLALRRREYEQMHDRQRAMVMEAQIDRVEDEADFGDQRKRKRNKEYLDWYLGKKG
ncbi:MAG: hypothetical protein ACFFE8_08835 [Candidatus Heimdallarchaeota archaeon]